MRLRIADCGLRIACVAAMLPALAATAFAQSKPADAKPPVLFARSKQNVTFEAIGHKEIVLRAFGRVWAKSTGSLTNVDTGKVVPLIAAPTVRVPTLFTMTPPDAPDSTLAELVVYPDRSVTWDTDIVLVAHGAPAWFLEWSFAVGLPATWTTKDAKIPGDLLKLKEGQRALLILGRSTAGADLSEVAKLARDSKYNVLVLDANWFGEPAGAASVKPAHMHGGLAEIARQRWPKPLEFTAHRTPWPGIANRWAWIVDGNGLPLVEQIMFVSSDGTYTYDRGTVSDTSRPILLNYLPWQNRLGRDEAVDETFLTLLRNSAKCTAAVRDVEITFVDPPKGLNLKDRPVLAAAILPTRAVHGVISPQRRVEFVKILDLRGSDVSPEYVASQRQTMQEFVEHSRSRATLLILGDDKLLDDWKWLKLDRDKKRIGRAGVQWLPADELPPSKDDQIRLMLKLTELGVPLVPPSQEEKKQ